MPLIDNEVTCVDADFQSSVPNVTKKQLREIGVNTDSVFAAFMGGSKVICNPPPTDTDTDYCVLVRRIGDFVDENPDWEFIKEDYCGENSTFTTCRRGEYNLLVFSDATEYGACRGATAIAKKANIIDKSKRYRLFETARSPWR